MSKFVPGVILLDFHGEMVVQLMGGICMCSYYSAGRRLSIRIFINDFDGSGGIKCFRELHLENTNTFINTTVSPINCSDKGYQPTCIVNWVSLCKRLSCPVLIDS